MLINPINPKMAPDLTSSTREERPAFVSGLWKCLHNGEACGKCHVRKGRDERALYADHINGIWSYMDITRHLTGMQE